MESITITYLSLIKDEGRHMQDVSPYPSHFLLQTALDCTHSKRQDSARFINTVMAYLLRIAYSLFFCRLILAL